MEGALREVYSKAAKRMPGQGIALTDSETQRVIAALNGEPA